MRYSSLLCLLSVCALGETALAQTTVPNTFTSGTPAVAADVNENFQALVTAIDTLAARVSKLEGGPTTDEDIVGTYRTSNLQIGLDWVAAGPGHVEAITYEGTLTFAADHTFTTTFTGRENDDDGPDPDDGTVTGTWTLADNDLTFSVAGSDPDTLHCALGCRLIFGTLYGGAEAVGDDGHNNLIVLVREE